MERAAINREVSTTATDGPTTRTPWQTTGGAEQRGAQAWRVYVEDVQAWRDEYVRLAKRCAAAMGTGEK